MSQSEVFLVIYYNIKDVLLGAVVDGEDDNFVVVVEPSKY